MARTKPVNKKVNAAQTTSADLSVGTANSDRVGTFALDAYNTGSNVDVTGLNFSTSTDRSVVIFYTVYRSTSSVTVVENGSLLLAYNPTNSSGTKWSVARSWMGSDTSIDFTATDLGQVQFTTTSIAGTGHTGLLTYSAKVLKQS